MPIQVNDLGVGGVNVDSSPLDLQDSELTNSQNATRGTLKNRASALIKRRGLEKLNQETLGAAILGGIEAPYQGTAQAPANGSGGGIINTGDPNLGTGVAPGGSTSVPGNPGSGGNQGNTGIGVGASIFSQAPLFGGARLVIFGKDTSTIDDSGLGFIVMPSGLAATPIVALSNGAQLPAHVGPDCNANQTFIETPNTAVVRVFRCFDVANGACYFAHGKPGEDGLSTSPSPQSIIKISADGKSITKVIDVPENASIVATNPERRAFITSLRTEYGNGDAMWVAVWDEVRSGGLTGHYGRVLRLTGLDSGAYAFTEIYNSFTTLGGSDFNSTPIVPFCLFTFLGNMWMGCARGVSGGKFPVAAMFRPNQTWPNGWEITRFIDTESDASWSDIVCAKEFNGTLYLGYLNRNPTVTAAVIASLDAAGNFTNPSLTGSAGTTGSPNGFISMEVFNGKLYASYLNTNGAKIYVFDGSSWSTAKTPGTLAYMLWADTSAGLLYAWSGVATSTSRSVFVTSDGVTWTDVSANFTVAGNNVVPTDMIFAFDQV